MNELYEYMTGSFLDEDTGKYWYEIGSMFEGKWLPVVISGVNYSSRLVADCAGNRQLPVVLKAINRHILRLQEKVA